MGRLHLKFFLTQLSWKCAACAAAPIVTVIILLALSATTVSAQNCNKLKPSGEGRDDAAIINECLRTRGRAKLKEGTFLLYGPIIFPRNSKMREVSGVKLMGKGAEETKLLLQSSCDTPWPFVAGQEASQYQPAIQVIRSPGAIIKELEIDLTNLRRDCGYLGNYMLIINNSPGAQATELRIAGSQYGTPEYTSGGANSGGIRVTNSAGSLVSDNVIKDVGFAKENGEGSAGYSGIAIENSGDSAIRNNQVVRVSFGITISNSSPQHGFSGDSSGTTVTGNIIVGAANINCPDCSQGRAIKLQACALGDEQHLEKLTVSQNIASEFGGANGVQAGSGLDLVCGVKYSTFDGNSFIGASTAEFGLQIRSSFLSPRNTTHHNQFSFNTFISGKGQVGCNNECADVNFTNDGPDQIGIRRNGENRLGTNSLSSLRSATDRGCNDFSHAFFNYHGGKDFVRQQESILLAASGIRPLSSVTFRFKRADDGVEVATYKTQTANRNCVVNQEDYLVDPAIFSPGFYNIFAEYQDGNSDASISDDPIGVIRVRPAKED